MPLPPPSPPAGALQVYLLGQTDFDAALLLQQALVYQVAGDRRLAALVLCEHDGLITVGRQGRPAHVRLGPEELRARRWRLRWVNRGGGTVLHLPGQLAVYPVLALDRLGLSVGGYTDRLRQVLRATLDDFGVIAEPHHGHARAPGGPGLWVGDRPVAEVGVAVRHWVTSFGAVLNVDPDLEPYRHVQVGPDGAGPMTSLARERRGPLRPALVRERLLEHFAGAFGFAEPRLFFTHPLLEEARRRGAVKVGPR